ncbi:hypothetical protein AB0K12_48035 [Nonomuraea sp. NPDC049419]|uniref:hypothetical protein n=1 Tax=Nonomuraea sp. NPDC049419 TaxID=3155772 RepID=UPI003436DA9C
MPSGTLDGGDLASLEQAFMELTAGYAEHRAEHRAAQRDGHHSAVGGGDPR